MPHLTAIAFNTLHNNNCHLPNIQFQMPEEFLPRYSRLCLSKEFQIVIGSDSLQQRLASLVKFLQMLRHLTFGGVGGEQRSGSAGSVDLLSTLFLDR